MWTPILPLSKKGRREISDFFAEELLYDFVSEQLDPERSAAVREKLARGKTLTAEVRKISQALNYSRGLAKLNIPPAALTAIDEPETYLSELLKKTNFERWPLPIRWGAEALLVLSAVVVMLTVVPWDRVLRMGLPSRSRQLILAEVSHAPLPPVTESDAVPITAAQVAIEPKPTAEFEDEGVRKDAPAPSPHQPVPSPVAARTVVTVDPPAAAEDRETPAKKGAEGAIYRATFEVSNLDATSPKIRDKIVELGGRKAGEVELGWKKTPTSAYFHFTMPEAKYADLSAFLKKYGSTKIVKQKHPRMMPEGIIRLIITVDEADSGSDAEPTAEPTAEPSAGRDE